MIAYISSLTNGGCGFVFKVPVHVLKIPMLIQWNLDITTLYNEVSQNRIGLSSIFFDWFNWFDKSNSEQNRCSTRFD